MEISNQPGNSLRAAREAAGLAVSDVVHRTKFPRTIVEALERDDYTVFSSPTYARSYLSQYAAFLGVDPSKWLDFFEPAAFAGPQDVLSMIESPVHQEARPATAGTRSSSSVSMLPTLLLILLTAGLIYGAITGYTYLETRLGSIKEVPAPSTPTAPVASSPTATPVQGTGMAATAPAVVPAPATPTDSGPPPRATIVHE